MITDVRFKILINGDPAPASLVDDVSEIVVDQEMELAWEARITMTMCMDARGDWVGSEQRFLETHTRVRIEVATDGHRFAPLIDGLLVGIDTTFSGDPGQSRRALVVRDDSVKLDREERVRRHDDRSDSEIAESIFRDAEIQTRPDDIERTEVPSGPRPRECMQRATDMAFIRRLARRNNKLAFVLPGERSGQLRGMFHAVPLDGVERLPPLVLAGWKRNIESFTADADAHSPARIVTAQLDLDERAVVTRTVSLRREELLGEEPALEEDEQRSELEQDGEGSCGDPIAAAEARAYRLGHFIDARGTTSSRCYGGVLMPYHAVDVHGVSGKLSGRYEIRQVTHTLGSDGYSQEFSLRRNAYSRARGAASTSIPAGVF